MAHPSRLEGASGTGEAAVRAKWKGCTLYSVHVRSVPSSRKVVPLESSGAICLNDWDQFLPVVMQPLPQPVGVRVLGLPPPGGGCSQGPRGSGRATLGSQGCGPPAEALPKKASDAAGGVG